MKRKHLSKWAAVALTAMLAWACSDPVSNNNPGGGTAGDTPPGSGSVGGTDAAKITFEESSSAISGTSGYAYDPGTALTTVSTAITGAADTGYFYAGKQSLKLTGTLQQDKYDTTGTTLNDPPKVREMAMRFKLNAASGTSGASVDLTDKIVSVAVYIPSGSTNNALQLVLVDTGYQQAISPAVNVVPSKWNLFYFKADRANLKNGKPGFTNVDANKAFVAAGSYSSATFDSTAVMQIEARSLGAKVGDAATIYIDSLSWTDQSFATVAEAPTANVAPGTYDAAQTVTLTSTTAGATIKYTDDGTDPTTSTTVKTYSTPLSVAASTTIKAFATATNFSASAVTTLSYAIQAIAPVLSLADGSFSTSQSLTLTTTTATASIYYNLTTDASVPADPTAASTLYKGALSITLPTNGTKYYKIKAVAIKNGLPASAIVAGAYVLSPPNASLAPPVTVATFDSDAAGKTYPIVTATAGSVTGKVVLIGDALVAAATKGATTGNSTANVLEVGSTGYNQYVKFSVTLPAGHSLSEYGSVSVAGLFPNNGGDNGYKSLNAFIGTSLPDGTVLYNADGTGYTKSTSYVGTSSSTGATGTAWKTLSIAIDPTVAASVSGTSLELAIGISRSGGAAGPYYLDTVSLIPNAVAVTTFEADTTGQAYPILSGTAGSVTAKVVVIGDVLTAAATKGATTLNSSAKVLEVGSTGYQQYARIPVALPQGTTLSQYAYVSVKAVFPNNGGDNGYKTLEVFIDGTLPDGTSLYNASGSGYTESTSHVGTSASTGGQGTAWTTFLIPINSTKAAAVTATTVDLAIGISRNGTAAGPFYLDDIGLVPK